MGKRTADNLLDCRTPLLCPLGVIKTLDLPLYSYYTHPSWATQTHG